MKETHSIHTLESVALLAEVEKRVEHFVTLFEKLRLEIGKVIVGQEDVVNSVITGLLAGGHVLLEGVPGLGKTRLVKTLSQCLSLKFSRIQFTPDLMPADITGTTVLHEEDLRKIVRFRPGPLFGQIILVDEINRGSPKTQSALLEAMQEGAVTVGRETHELPQPFFVLATQNPIEMEGTYPLPEAELDRFLFKVKVEFPSREKMHEILDRTIHLQQPVPEPVLGADSIAQMGRITREVAIAKEVQDFAIELMLRTHPEFSGGPDIVKQSVRYGSSPRGAQAMILGAKVQALLDGRFAVSRKDIRNLARISLRHRLVLNFKAEAKNVDPDSVIDAILDTVEG